MDVYVPSAVTEGSEVSRFTPDRRDVEIWSPCRQALAVTFRDSYWHRSILDLAVG